MRAVILLVVLGPLFAAGLSLQPVDPLPTSCPRLLCPLLEPELPRPQCHQCQGPDDRRCGPGGACCTDCNGCRYCLGGTTPNPTPQPNPVDSCRNKKCRRGFECKLRTFQCFAPPCQTRPVCVPTAPKPGSCPRYRCPIPLNPQCRGRQCRSDSQCRGNLKCCTDCSGCKVCVEPFVLPDPLVTAPPASSCAAVSCEVGSICVEEPEPHCEKAGVCPAPSGLITTCEFNPDYNCLLDSECEGAQKCCSEGCGKVCKQPIFTSK